MYKIGIDVGAFIGYKLAPTLIDMLWLIYVVK